jgi:phosphoribosylformimino-5-aminoimidazole carboxamide ribotide isomerase
VTAFELYPAIDLRGGRCVRLLRGDYDAETVYGDDPAAVAATFVAAGAPWIHAVDLDAARGGEAVNTTAIAGIVAVAAPAGVRVEVGGGVRSVEAAERLLDLGVHRVVVGTAAVRRPELVAELATAHPGRVAVGLDARGRRVAVQGWTEDAGVDLVELAQRFDELGVALVVTEIGRDGTMEGPDLDQLAAVVAATSVDVVASGGVGELADLAALAELDVGGRRLAGAIVGRALYEHRFDVAGALAVVGGAR